MAEKIERLRNGAVTGCETVCPHVRGTVTLHCSLNFTLTDDEREAVSLAYSRLTADAKYEEVAATLKALLGRTTHDAAPDATARTDPSESSVPRGNGGGCGGTDKPVTLPAMGTGNLSEAEIDALEYVVEEGRIASMDDYGILRSWLIRLRSEWENKSYDEGDEKRTNTNTDRDATPSEGSMNEGCTLTDAERLALEFAVETGRVATHDAATLRKLLARLA